MSTVEEALRGGSAPGLYMLRSSVDFKAIERLTDELGFRFFLIDGVEVSSKVQFLDRIASVMGFPSYFRSNWDALDECITDLNWCPAKGYPVVYHGFEPFAETPPSDFKIAVETLREATEHWMNSESPMFVLLKGNDVPISLVDCPTL